MSIVATCPSCKQQCTVPDGSEGRRVACPACKTPFVVKADAARAVEVPPEQPELAEFPRGQGMSLQQLGRSLENLRGWAWLICLGLVLVVWLVQMIIYLAADNYLHAAAVAMEGCAWILTLYVVTRAFESAGQAFGRKKKRARDVDDVE